MTSEHIALGVLCHYDRSELISDSDIGGVWYETERSQWPVDRRACRERNPHRRVECIAIQVAHTCAYHQLVIGVGCEISSWPKHYRRCNAVQNLGATGDLRSPVEQPDR